MTGPYNPGSRFRPRSPYAPRIDPMNGKNPEFHAGQDFAAPAGTPIPAAALGKVVYSGFNKNLGNVVIVRNETGSYSLYGHMLDGSRAELGQKIWPGDTVGLVGSTGARTTGPHLHYSVITKEAGDKDEVFPSKGGGIGLSLNDKTTVDPARYDNYDPTPRYLDETKRAAEIMSGTGAGTDARGPLPDRPESFDNRFGKWGSSPASVAPIAASDNPASFDSRFGNWGSAPAGGSGETHSPVLRELQKHRKSAALDDPTRASAQAASSPTPAFRPDSVYSPAGNLVGNVPRVSAAATPSPLVFNAPEVSSSPRPAGDFNALGQGVARLLYGPDRVVGNSSVAPAAAGSSGMPAPEPGPSLGIVSGKPMSQWPPPQVFGLPDTSNESANSDWFNLLAGTGSPNSTPRAPAPDASKPMRYLSRRIVDPSPTPAFDTSEPPPLAPSDDASFVGGLAGRIAALAGIDLRNPTQFAPPQLDDRLRDFYRDDPQQPWFVQGRR